jgi:GNAT superfamily N-acetyltransferase
MTSPVRIEAVPLDGPDGARLIAEFVAEISSRYPGWTPSAGPSAEPHEFVPPAGRFVVASIDGLPVGCGGYTRIGDHAAEIKRVYVRPDGRGGGVARAMLEHLESAARDAGYAFVRLDTGDQQPDALALFDSGGYTRIADYNGNEFASYWFEKRL